MVIGLGIDCEEIARWEGLHRDASSDPRHALFSVSEHEYCSSRVNSAHHYAGRWCVKEATVKALSGIASITTRNVVVEHVSGGNPHVSLIGNVSLPRQIALMTSVTHTDSTAAAVVIALSEKC